MPIAANANIITLVQAYMDQQISSNPRNIAVNRSCQVLNTPITNPRNETLTPPLQIGETRTLWDGARTVIFGGSDTLSISLSPLSPTRYRLTWSGTTAPFRTNRNLTLSGVAVTFTANNNGSVNVTTPTAQFSAVRIGDTVFLPDISTGDTVNGAFNPLNTGFWIVQSVISTSNIQLVRLPTFNPVTLASTGVIFSGVTETQTPSSNTQFQCFSASGIQIGDKVLISPSLTVNPNFSPANFNQYSIVQVTATWFEIMNVNPLALDQNINVVSGNNISFFSFAKRFVRVETDQQIAVNLNGSTDNNNRLFPWLSGDPADSSIAFMDKVGSVYRIDLVNLSNSIANINVISFE